MPVVCVVGVMCACGVLGGCGVCLWHVCRYRYHPGTYLGNEYNYFYLMNLISGTCGYFMGLVCFCLHSLILCLFYDI